MSGHCLCSLIDHTDEEASNDGLSCNEIFDSMQTGEIIEQYPDDKPYPSSLILSKNLNGEPVHSVWAYNHVAKASALLTVYRPDPDQWIDWKLRRES